MKRETNRDAAPRVLALGSPHGDDRAAWYVVDALSRNSDVDLRCDKLKSPWEILAFLPLDGKVIILDACISGSPPGTLHRLRPDQLEVFRGTHCSSHGTGLAYVLNLARSLGYDVSGVVILALEAASLAPGEEITAPVVVAVEEMVNELSSYSSGESSYRDGARGVPYA
jgi:hydrogenase maturation protease